MAKPILVANWKNYPNSLPEAQTLMRDLSRQKLLYKKVSLYIAPPLTYLDLIGRSGKSFSQLAAQDLSNLEKGTQTGTVTPEILKSFGVRLAILGHSERRALGESSVDVSQKIKTALKVGITPLVCVGEISRDSEGEHFEFLRDELKTTLATLNKKEVNKIMLAYEPVWAIGKSAKEAIDPLELSQTIIFIRKVLSDLFGREAAESIPLLYGGSVEARNAKALMKDSGLRGFLVGHESLKAAHFKEIALALISK
jgi:triosephosphate isomerase